MYTIIGIVEINGAPQLLKMRNPWALEEYEGPWND